MADVVSVIPGTTVNGHFFNELSMPDYTDANALYEAYRKARKGSSWKSSVQHYDMNFLRNICSTQKALRTATYTQEPFFEFTLHERGKSRRIRSMDIKDRVVQRSLCDNLLVPLLAPKLIYDNGASVSGKGISFTRNRLQAHLEKYARRHGSQGYVLLMDFSKYFDNIEHKPLLSMLPDMGILHYLIGTFGDGKSLGIGSQISQVLGVYFTTPIDRFVKNTMHLKYYGRYMDDCYAIHSDKSVLHNVLEGIRTIASSLGIVINENKTQIIPLQRGFTFMQVKYSITSDGKVLRRLKSDRFARERKMLRKYRVLLDKGKVTAKDVACDYKAWHNNLRGFKCHRSVRAVDALYNTLF